MPSTTTIREILHSSYERENWQSLLVDLFPNGALKLLGIPEDLQVTADKVSATRQLGTLILPGDDEKVALLEITTTDQIKLARNRVGLRNFVASFIDQANASAVLAVFQQPDSSDWRLTLATRKTTLDQDTFEITTVETAPRRFTFLLGENESCRTAAGRLSLLHDQQDELTLGDLEKAFSVESLSKEFFKKYKEHYLEFVAHLFSDEQVKGTRELFNLAEEDDDFEKGKANKPVRDFVKTLLGRLVFLSFLQKKGWLGCPAKSRQWKEGKSDFLQFFLQLAEDQGEADLFHSKYLTSLFFDALNNDERSNDLFDLTNSRLPYLNGGLFEDDDDHARSLDFPPQLFHDLLNFFDEYNFTIDENDPEDHEVGIDPEMLGMIFENLLEDNREKGTYYTPKAIVSYMARQSLLHYLQTHLGERQDLEKLLNEKNSEELPAFVEQNKDHIVELLSKVTICDPAIGSGAFPIGLLHEILWTRLTLEPEKNTPEDRATLKRDIIQNSIHGVDIDPGAIEIARLRFWLALVVDEDAPRPLPNLDYKIHRADSLIEYIRGEPVNHGTQLPASPTMRAAINDLIQAKRDLFVAQGLPGKRKAWFALYRALALVGQTEFTTLRNEEGLFAEGERVAKLDQNAHAFGQWITKIDAVQKQKVHYQETLLAQLRQWFDDEQHPTFLWNLHFGGIFAHGGFDVVIANPPYVRAELIKQLKPVLKKVGYECYSGTADLYTYFYELAIKILKENGTLSFITSNKFFLANYGKATRKQLCENLLHTVINYGEADIFDEVGVDSTTVILKKASPNRHHETNCLLWDKKAKPTQIQQQLESAFNLPQRLLNSDRWIIAESPLHPLISKLESTGVTLGNFTNKKFKYGIKTGYNKAYLVDSEAASKLEQECIRKFCDGNRIKRWRMVDSDKFIIKIESSSNRTHPWTNSKNPEQAFAKTYPKIYAHFSNPDHITKLKKRTDQGTNWWELRACDYWDDLEGPKILYNETSKRFHAYLDNGSVIPNKTLFAICSPEAGYIMGILMSLTAEFLFYWTFPSYGIPIKGGRVQFQKRILMDFPVPTASDTDKAKLATLAEQCAAATAADNQLALEAHEHEINQIVYRLFDLTPDEIALIESSLES